jgi:succinyl-CoA synthetase beta subunit
VAVLIEKMWKLFVATDATLVEVNPLVRTNDDRIVALDGKVTLDENANFRHSENENFVDTANVDPLETAAKAKDLNYVKLDGNVGCMVNGAGLAMATMDIIKLSGGDPANFLDVGGSANATTVEAGFRIILKDPNVKAILINIFGGIVRCDRVAQGVVDAYKSIGTIPVPIIVRLQGTNAEAAKKLIDESGLKVYSAIVLKEAAELVQKAVAGNI